MIPTKTSILLAVTLALQSGNAAFAQGIFDALLESPAPETSVEIEPSRFAFAPAGTLAVLESPKGSTPGKAIEIATATRQKNSINLWTARGPDGSAVGIEIVYDTVAQAQKKLNWISKQTNPIGIYATGCLKNGDIAKGRPSGKSHSVWKLRCSGSNDFVSSNGAYIHNKPIYAQAYEIVSTSENGAIGNLYASSIAPRLEQKENSGLVLAGQSLTGPGK